MKTLKKMLITMILLYLLICIGFGEIALLILTGYILYKLAKVLVKVFLGVSFIKMLKRL